MLNDMIAELSGNVAGVDYASEVCELPFEFFSRVAVHRVSDSGCIKRPEMNETSLVHYAGCPSSATWLELDTFNPATIVFLATSVGLLLVSICNPDIAALIVEGIVIAVVTLASIAIFQTKNLSVHPDLNAWLTDFTGKFSYGIVTLRVGIPVGVPFPCREQGEVLNAYFGKLSLSERNFTVRWFWGHARVHLAGRIRPVLITPDPFILSLAGGA